MHTAGPLSVSRLSRTYWERHLRGCCVRIRPCISAFLFSLSKELWNRHYNSPEKNFFNSASSMSWGKLPTNNWWLSGNRDDLPRSSPLSLLSTNRLPAPRSLLSPRSLLVSLCGCGNDSVFLIPGGPPPICVMTIPCDSGDVFTTDDGGCWMEKL